MLLGQTESEDMQKKAEGLVRGVGAKAKQPGPGVHDELSRHRRPINDENFSLTIRAEDGRTLLEARVEYMHQAFQRLIDWSIGEAGYDVSAVSVDQTAFTRTTESRLRETLLG